MWEVHYSHEAATYLEDNGQLIAALFFAMESLADSAGIPNDRAPQNSASQDSAGLVYWTVLDHIVVYRRIESEKVVRIIYIKPD